jgi:hypothetical protein
MSNRAHTFHIFLLYYACNSDNAVLFFRQRMTLLSISAFCFSLVQSTRSFTSSMSFTRRARSPKSRNHKPSKKKSLRTGGRSGSALESTIRTGPLVYLFVVRNFKCRCQLISVIVLWFGDGHGCNKELEERRRRELGGTSVVMHLLSTVGASYRV